MTKYADGLDMQPIFVLAIIDMIATAIKKILLQI